MNDEVKEIECSLCDGRGEVCWNFPLMETCQVCNGTGKYTITKNEVDEEIASLRLDIHDIEDEIQRLAEIFNG